MTKHDETWRERKPLHLPGKNMVSQEYIVAEANPEKGYYDILVGQLQMLQDPPYLLGKAVV